MRESWLSVRNLMRDEASQTHRNSSGSLLVPPAEAGDEERGNMRGDFKVGDHVEWNSEAGMVTGTIIKKVTSEITFKGYTVHASEDEPQYLIKSDKTDHEAMHKGSALKKIKPDKKHHSRADEKKS